MTDVNYDLNSDSDDEDDNNLPTFQQTTSWTLNDINQVGSDLCFEQYCCRIVILRLLELIFSQFFILFVQ
jgi:DNA-directed RNA polymerase subunit N (RpoN/RPB10)